MACRNLRAYLKSTDRGFLEFLEEVSSRKVSRTQRRSLRQATARTRAGATTFGQLNVHTNSRANRIRSGAQPVIPG